MSNMYFYQPFTPAKVRLEYEIEGVKQSNEIKLYEGSPLSKLLQEQYIYEQRFEEDVKQREEEAKRVYQLAVSQLEIIGIKKIVTITEAVDGN